MSNFEPFGEKNGTKGTNGMSVAVSTEGVYFGATITRDVLDDPDYVEWLVDADAARVGFRPVDDLDEVASAYSVSEFAARAAPIWDTIGAEVDETTHVPVDTESESFPVIDMSEFVADSPADDDGDEGDNPLDIECEVCGRGFDSETGRNIHMGRMHDENDDDGDVLDRERIETALEQVGVDDVEPEEVIKAIDLQPRIFQVATQLDIPRGDADDLVRRLDLKDALESDDGLARKRFEGGGSA